MLPEVGATEYLIIAVVALIVVGPKDLPALLRRLGQFVAKLRGMASEFRASFDEMARQSELDDLRKEVEAMRRGQFADMADHDREMRSTVGDIQQSLSDVGVQLHPPMSYQYDSLEAPPSPEPVEAVALPARKPRAAKAKAATATATGAKPTGGRSKAAAAKPKAAAARASRKPAAKGKSPSPGRKTSGAES